MRSPVAHNSGTTLVAFNIVKGVSVDGKRSVLAHILERAELPGMAAEVERVLCEPQLVRRSRSDEAVRLFYEF